MTYSETLDYIYSHLPMYHRIGPAAYKADLNTTIAICNMLGNPQDSFRSVHIAGTNGKGSTSHLLASVLQECGFSVGLFTSPHLKDFRERIRVNGKMIPEEKVTGFIDKHKADFEKLNPSFFEMTAGLAFDFFREEKIDIGVIEVGLGGRLDSTNVITPLLSVITNISFDHMQFLGDTLEKIAREKAGIIKPSVPVVIGETQVEILHVFLEKARETGSEIFFADALFSLTGWKRKEDGQPAVLSGILKDNLPWLEEIVSPVTGNYQKKNILTLCAVCDILRKQGMDIPDEKIRSGIHNVIRNTGFSGRWQILSDLPLTICDTGHNEAGLKEVLTQITETPHRKLHFVFGVVNDKEIDPMLQMLPRTAIYYFCKADIPRGLDAEELRTKATEAGLEGDAFPSVKAAIAAARERAGKNDLVFIGGSTFIVAEAV
ncbi:MAG: bifunctional folylpolyglutamate synthase/dihydrofolate synthase [Bacteroidetes bacterium]|nr:bifunctional folylpolyglutamate synthase/dihydrofolate synthase [Bacteroidota bacterium]